MCVNVCVYNNREIANYCGCFHKRCILAFHTVQRTSEIYNDMNSPTDKLAVIDTLEPTVGGFGLTVMLRIFP